MGYTKFFCSIAKEKFGHVLNEPKSTKEAVSRFLDGDNDAIIPHKDEIGEFCLQIRDSYTENDKTTPFLKLSMLIEELL